MRRIARNSDDFLAHRLHCELAELFVIVSLELQENVIDLDYMVPSTNLPQSAAT